MSRRSAGSSGLPGLARAVSTLAGATSGCPVDCAETRWMRGGALLHDGVSRRCQHLIGDPIRFLFVDITRLVDLEFGLQTNASFCCTPHTRLSYQPRHRRHTYAGRAPRLLE